MQRNVRARHRPRKGGEVEGGDEGGRWSSDQGSTYGKEGGWVGGWVNVCAGCGYCMGSGRMCVRAGESYGSRARVKWRVSVGESVRVCGQCGGGRQRAWAWANNYRSLGKRAGQLGDAAATGGMLSRESLTHLEGGLRAL